MAKLTGGKFYEGALMGAASGAIAFGASELIGVYLPAIKELEARAIEMLGGEAEVLRRQSLDRKFTDPLKMSDRTEAEYFDRVRALYEATKDKFSPNVNLPRSVDIGNTGVRFGRLHVRLQEGSTVFHFDKFGMVTDPINYFREYLYQKYVYGIK